METSLGIEYIVQFIQWGHMATSLLPSEEAGGIKAAASQR